MANIISPSRKSYLFQVGDAIIAIQGHVLTSGRQTKESGTQLYVLVVKYLVEDRFNVDFKKVIADRETFAAHIFTQITELEKEDYQFLQEEVIKCDNDTSNVNIKAAQDMWKRFGEIKSECRGKWGSAYESEYTKKYKSGSYTDGEVLLNIWQEEHERKVNKNFEKNVSNA